MRKSEPGSDDADPEPDDANATADDPGASAHVHVCIEERLRSCRYTFHFNKVTWNYAEGILTLQGSVATFHLKQILQTMLRDVEYVQQLVNEVDVVSATGLSNERKRHR